MQHFHNFEILYMCKTRLLLTSQNYPYYMNQTNKQFSYGTIAIHTPAIKIFSRCRICHLLLCN